MSNKSTKDNKGGAVKTLLPPVKEELTAKKGALTGKKGNGKTGGAKTLRPAPHPTSVLALAMLRLT